MGQDLAVDTPNKPTNGAVDPAVAKKVIFFSITSVSLLNVTCMDLFILSFNEFKSDDFIATPFLLLFFHSLIAEQKILDFGSF